MSSIESAEIKDVLELTYSHAIGEHTDILTVTMQAIVSIAVIDEQDAYRVGYKTLQNQLGSNMKLYEDTVYYSHSNTTSTNQPGEVSIQVTAKGIAAPDITLTNVRNTIRWKPVAQAKRDLLQTFPLGKSPDIVIRPAWLNRIPWLTWRTRITINQPDFATN